MNNTSIHFEKASLKHKEIIFQWLDKPHVREFWDNSQRHRDDILDFMNGRKEPSPYFGGIMTYWVGMIDTDPFCFLLTSEFIPNESSSALWNENCSKSGKTFTIDFCIGNENYLRKGLASLTLEAFIRYFQKEINKEADTFFIDPDENNPKARRVYEKAGFKSVSEFMMDGGFFAGHKSILMVKRLPRIIQATMADYSIIQSMAPYYMYDMYRYCGWEFPKDGQFKTLDYKIYFSAPGRHAFIIELNDELAGFALINKVGTSTDVEWNIGEFFILAKFQGKTVGEQIAFQVWDQLSGIWEVPIIPENSRALYFWRKVITKYTSGHFSEVSKVVHYDGKPTHRVIFKFNTLQKNNMNLNYSCNTDKYQWEIKHFHELTKQELYEILKFRMEIFILEQNSIYLDLDNMDQQSMHFSCIDKGRLIAYGRVSFDESKKLAEIRRVSIHKDYRQKRLGSVLMKKMLEFIDSRSTVTTIELDAQHHLQAFYEKHGFNVAGYPYDDGGVMHIKMTKKMKRENLS